MSEYAVLQSVQPVRQFPMGANAVLHRSDVSDADKLTAPDVTATDQTAFTGVMTNAEHNVVVIQRNRYGAAYTYNNGYFIDNISEIDCEGRQKAYVHVKMKAANFDSGVPTLALVPFYKMKGTNEFAQGEVREISFLSEAGESLSQVFVLDVDGCKGLKIAVDTISNGTLDLWVGLV